ncbi:unnamed protein product [Didymodactylos carnosus]|uniref:G-protein coupled receptors family 1 profile domain-containing protein n=1 Tax=Didymodactylos carnosus TaxID=1234261 RepID=A0A815K5X7_9BILA|nr:unnamed protein product [Didymodactylos carnosus]CAF4283745.1 unnamed protein product [Didymodactylos carnosus]
MLKPNVPYSWYVYLLDVKFGFNYHTLRSIFSEIIPSLLVTLFNIGIILRVIEASFQLRNSLTLVAARNSKTATDTNCPSSTRPSTPQENSSTTQNIEKSMTHNRPKTSWMNMVLILHSCLFFFSSLTHTIVHLFTSDALLSHSVSVVILANCSLNFYVYCLSGKTFRTEIKRLFKHHFQYYFQLKFLNIFRTKSQRSKVGREVRLNIIRQHSSMVHRKTTENESQKQQTVLTLNSRQRYLNV